MRILRGMGAGLAVVFVVVGCKSEGAPAPATPITATMGDGGADPLRVAAAAPASATDGGPDFYACAADSDCVAVPRVGCCFNGHLEAVNKSEVDAYKASFTCEQKRPICPQYRVLDRRTPECITAGDGGSGGHCQMLKPDEIVCGGAHQCPTGFTCQASKCVNANAGAAPSAPSTTP